MTSRPQDPMDTPSHESVLRSLLEERTGRDLSGVGPDDDLVLALGLDSLARLRLLAAAEKRLDVRLRDADLGGIRTLRQLEQAVRSAKGGTP